MSADSYHLHVYWGNRQETEVDCATRCADMMARLASIDPVFGQWCKTAMSRKAANKPFCGMPPTIEELAHAFDKGRHYKGHPKIKEQPYRVWPEMGMSIGPWNGLDRPFSTALLLSAAAFGEERRRYPNHIELGITKRRLKTDQPWMASELRDVLLAVVEPWEAAYAVIIGNRFFDTVPQALNEYNIEKPIWPYAGWMTYLTKPASDRLVPPQGTIVERFSNDAVLVSLCEEPCDPANPRHMELADAMHLAMRPVQQEYRY